jgi:hypothetical protein
MHTDDDRSLHSNAELLGDLEMADMESGRTTGGSISGGSDLDEMSINSTKKGLHGGTESDEAYDVDDMEEDEDDDGGDAAELSWRDLKVTSPDGKKVLLSEACGRVKGRFLAIMGPSGAGKVIATSHLAALYSRNLFYPRVPYLLFFLFFISFYCFDYLGHGRSFYGTSCDAQTSLMNMLACRLAKAKGKGDQMVDGQSYNRAFLKKVSGYVMQVPRPALLCCTTCLWPYQHTFVSSFVRTICSSPTLR